MTYPSGAWGFSQPGLVIAQTVIIEGSKSGLFVYNGTPGPGNPPIFAIVAPGTTQDKYGNPVSAVMNVGNLSGAHAGFDISGIEYLSGPSGFVDIIIDPTRSALFVYNPSAGSGALAGSWAVNAGTDDFGNPFLDGFATYQYTAGVLTSAMQLGAGIVNFLSWDGANWINDSEIFSGANGRLLYTAVAGGSSPGDGNTYGIGKIVAQLTGGAVTSTGTTPIPVLTMNVSPGKYLIRGVVFGQQGATAVGQNLAFQGTATRSNTSIATIGIQTGALENSFAQIINTGSSTQVSGATPANVGMNIHFEGLLIISAGGTLTLSIADGTAGDHWKANNNTYMVLEPVN